MTRSFCYMVFLHGNDALGEVLFSFSIWFHLPAAFKFHPQSYYSPIPAPFILWPIQAQTLLIWGVGKGADTECFVTKQGKKIKTSRCDLEFSVAEITTLRKKTNAWSLVSIYCTLFYPENNLVSIGIRKNTNRTLKSYRFYTAYTLCGTPVTCALWELW